MYDMHTHSRFSDDGSYSMKVMAQSALDKGLNAICITDHVDPLHPLEETFIPYDYPGYTKELNETRQLFSSHPTEVFQILRGVEMGLQPHILKECTDFFDDKEYDFVIGSMHVIRGVDMYMDTYREMGNSEKLTDMYFEDLIKCVKGYDAFSVLGHSDVIRRYLHKKDADYSFEKVKDRLAEVFETLINKGKGIEVNTSGLRYQLSSSTPGPKAIQLYKDLGGEIITLGSDAHRPVDVGHLFHENAEMLKSIGFQHACYFKELKPVFYKL